MYLITRIPVVFCLICALDLLKVLIIFFPAKSFLVAPTFWVAEDKIFRIDANFVVTQYTGFNGTN